MRFSNLRILKADEKEFEGRLVAVYFFGSAASCACLFRYQER